MSSLQPLIRFLQFGDSMLPVGSFSFSNGLESAIQQKIVSDGESLGRFVRGVVTQVATLDGVALLHAFRAARAGELDRITEADRALFTRKLNEESRTMSVRMGRKLGELAVHVLHAPLAVDWLARMTSGSTPGTYPATQGMLYALLDLTESDAFAAHQYGVANQMLGASLRLMRIGHLDVQSLLFEINGEATAAYERVRETALADMASFNPILDVMAAIHVKSTVRLFMS